MRTGWVGNEIVAVLRSPHVPGRRACDDALMNYELRPEEQRRLAEARLVILDALVIAIDRRHELLRLLDDSADAQEARQRLMAAMDLDEVQATAVLDIQMRRLARRERELITAERDELIAQLESP